MLYIVVTWLHCSLNYYTLNLLSIYDTGYLQTWSEYDGFMVGFETTVYLVQSICVTASHDRNITNNNFLRQPPLRFGVIRSEIDIILQNWIDLKSYLWLPQAPQMIWLKWELCIDRCNRSAKIVYRNHRSPLETENTEKVDNNSYTIFKRY